MAFIASKSYDLYISPSISQDAIQKGVQRAAPQYATMWRLEQQWRDGDIHERANEIELLGNGSYQIA
jgi:hypothetical protein